MAHHHIAVHVAELLQQLTGIAALGQIGLDRRIEGVDRPLAGGGHLQAPLVVKHRHLSLAVRRADSGPQAASGTGTRAGGTGRPGTSTRVRKIAPARS